ncbi:hypothetical protein CaCOL14_009851 [Colletotrichum acutatum]
MNILSINWSPSMICISSSLVARKTPLELELPPSVLLKELME